MITREELGRRMDLATRQFTEIHERSFRTEIEQLSLKLADLRHLAELEDALSSSRCERVRSVDVRVALNFLQKRSGPKWPFDQLSKALDTENVDGRQAILDALLRTIRLTVEKRASRVLSL